MTEYTNDTIYIFDVDGTFYPQRFMMDKVLMKSWEDAFIRGLQRSNLKHLETETVRLLFERHNQDLAVETIFKDFPFLSEEEARIFFDNYKLSEEEMKVMGSTLAPHAADFEKIKELQNQKYILTDNCYDWTTRLTAEWGHDIHEIFTGISTVPACFTTKKYVERFHMFEDQYQLNGENKIFFDDNERNCENAEKAGWKAELITAENTLNNAVEKYLEIERNQRS